MKLNKRIYGVVGIRSIMSNWNADFSGYPKSTSNGDFFGSDKAFKYPIKKMWQAEGEKVVYVKSYKLEKGKFQPRDLAEQYEAVFGEKVDDKTPSEKVLGNLFSALDVLSFGATFAEKKQNLSITGAVQIGQGFNKYEEAHVEVQDILSPFRNPKKDDADASSLGTKIVADEAHYFYPFSINPNSYDDYLGHGIEGFEGYTVEAYEKFKKACLLAATAFNTNSKVGCENEFALFIEGKEGSQFYLANVDRVIDFYKSDEGKNVICLAGLKDLLANKMGEIETIEVYYNKLDTELNLAGLDCNVYSLY